MGRVWSLIGSTALFGLFAANSPVSASVYYDLSVKLTSSTPVFEVEYKSDSFIKTDTIVQASNPRLVKCFFLPGCQSVEYTPNDHFFNATFDEILVKTQDPNATPTIITLPDGTQISVQPAQVEVGFDFRPGDFGAYGTYYASNNSAKLIVSDRLVGAVPLPSAAPLFGAALVALGAFGHRLRRKHGAA